jgi:putative ABC transport system ATP-binding protein
MSAIVEFKQVEKKYTVGGVQVAALAGVSMAIEPGEFASVIGPSGSGKSTLMHLLGFLDQPTAGTILFEGQDVSKISPRQRATIRANRIGFVFQAFNLLPRMTVMQNTLLPLAYSRGERLPRKISRQRAKEVLDAVGMADRSHHRPNQLSGGQRQRVAIARALINEPKLILADEPTGNVDTAMAANIMELFASLNRQGRTVVIVTHDMEVARHTRRSIRVREYWLPKTRTPKRSAKIPMPKPEIPMNNQIQNPNVDAWNCSAIRLCGGHRICFVIRHSDLRFHSDLGCRICDFSRGFRNSDFTPQV